ncbi:phage tail spike protein [Paucilactobacillus kaifaensis]|uniref:phage tail spike protein n=1 Tax=Paucilactobacillus kaifaensis TaxID=2559921 RepID=UPI0014854D89|nr:phage tail spike protein [Paucilactobacillus kaifaensis]
MQIYVLDRSKNALATTAKIYDDTHHKALTAGSSSFEFTIDKTDKAAEFMVSGNYIVFQDDRGKPWSFSILNYDETQNTKIVYTEDVGIELINKAVDIWTYTDPHPFEYYFDIVTDGTPWELGVNQLEGLTRTLTYDSRGTGLGRLLSILTAFNNAECTFDIQMQGTVPIKYVINVYKKIGYVQDNIQILYNRDLNDIKKTESRATFVTALSGVGSVIQDTNDTTETDVSKPEEHVDFADMEYDDGAFVTTKGDKFLRAKTANAQFNPGDQGYVESFYEYDTSSESELFNRTFTQLQKRSQPQFTYEADMQVIDPALDIGDTVKMIDHDYNPALYLQARVSTLDKSYTDPSKGGATFTNYTVLTSSIQAQIAALRQKVNGIRNGDTYFVWIRYADDDQGTGISASPKDKLYVALVAKKNQPIASNDPTDYKGHWMLVKGANGTNGLDGTDGNSAYLHMAYANSVDGKTDFTTDEDQAHNRDYLGTYSDDTSAQSSDPSKYVWQLTRGAQGLQGQPGSKDVPIVTVSSVEPASSKNGDMWYQQITDANGTSITGFFVRQSGKWVPSTIDQSVLVLTKLVSVEIDSATLNSPDITVPFDYFDEMQTEFKGSMEFKDGMLKHISTMTGGGMLKTVVRPTGYTLDAYANQSEYTKNNSYIHTELYADNISLSNANTKKSGILDSNGISGTLNDSTDSSIGMNIKWSDVQKYLPEMGRDGSKRAFNWFDMMSSVQSHPNLLKNSSFKDGLNNWENSKGWFTYPNDLGVHQGNVVAMSHGNNSNLWLGQMVSNVLGNQKMSYSFWYHQEGDKNTDGGVELRFENDDASRKSTFKYAIESTVPSSEWVYIEILPVISPDWASKVHFAFYNRNSQHMLVAQPMLCYGDHVWPYQPT